MLKVLEAETPSRLTPGATSATVPGPCAEDASGGVGIVGAQRLRRHESDRAATVAEGKTNATQLEQFLEERGEEMPAISALPAQHRKRMRTAHLLRRQTQEQARGAALSQRPRVFAADLGAADGVQS